MTFEAFINSLGDQTPPAPLSKALKALWYDGKSDWTKAHDVAQEEHTKEGSWVHAYLHRKEGDLGNASYWYNRAGKKIASGSLDQEWEEMAKALLGVR